MRFVVAIVLVLAAAAVAAAAGSARRESATATLAFVSVGDDRVGTTMRNTKPDGIPDAHFTLVVDAPGETVVKLGLRSTEPDGTPAFGQRWDTVPGGDWILAVFRNGVLLNPLDSGVTDALTGPATYELYAQSVAESGKALVVTGNSYRVDVTFASGGGIAVGTKIGSPGSRLLTPIAIASPPGTAAPPAVTPPPTTTPAVPTTPAAPVAGATGKPTIALRSNRLTARIRGCVTLTEVVTRAPAASRVVFELRAEGLWRVVPRRACSSSPGRFVYRATLKSGANVLARSKPLTITWKP